MTLKGSYIIIDSRKLFFLVPDDYNQIEEKEEKKTFVNSLWADSTNNPVMSSKLICVFQTENQQSKSEEILQSPSLFVRRA